MKVRITGQQAGDEHGPIAVAGKEAVGQFEIVVGDQQPAPVLFYQGPPSQRPDVIGHERSQIASHGPRQSYPEQPKSAGKNQVAGKRHDDFRRQWNAGGFNRHQ